MAKASGTWCYLDAQLSEAQMEETIESYDLYASNYSRTYEFDDEMIQRTKFDYLHPFISQLKIGDTVLVMGSGSGRDILELSQRGMSCIGIDASKSMINLSVHNGVRSPLLISDIRSIELPAVSYDGILSDSAFEHISKSDFEILLNKIIAALRIDGILLFRLRLGSGKVFKVKDEVGARYFQSYTKDEVDLLLSKYKEIDVIEKKVVKHKVIDRPGFYSLIIKKRTVNLSGEAI